MNKTLRARDSKDTSVWSRIAGLGFSVYDLGAQPPPKKK